MTLEEFEAKFGKSTDPADLDRANCTLGGTCGHSQCGLCEHGTPRFLKCEACKADLAKYAAQLEKLLGGVPLTAVPRRDPMYREKWKLRGR